MTSFWNLLLVYVYHTPTNQANPWISHLVGVGGGKWVKPIAWPYIAKMIGWMTQFFVGQYVVRM